MYVAIFEDSAKPILDEALQMCLRGLDAAKEAQNLPPELAEYDFFDSLCCSAHTRLAVNTGRRCRSCVRRLQISTENWTRT